MEHYILCVVLTSLQQEGRVFDRGSFVMLTEGQLAELRAEDVRPATLAEEESFDNGALTVDPDEAVLVPAADMLTDQNGEVVALVAASEATDSQEQETNPTTETEQ